MKIRLMDILVCPGCLQPFTLTIEKEERLDYSPEWTQKLQEYLKLKHENIPEPKGINEKYYREIIRGTLTCRSCGADYPIIDGIPVILPEELRTMLGVMGRFKPERDDRIHALLDHVKTVPSDDASLFNKIQKANQSNYGYEWKAFYREFAGWEEVYRGYYVFEGDEFFAGKLGLDAGCGNGRYTNVPTRKIAEMVGLDLSNAIEVAYHRSREDPLLHTVQGDIFHMPFRQDFFDFAQTLGVIHITPDPEAALAAIKQCVIPDGKIWLYVYPSFKDENWVRYYLLKVVNQIRRITVRMPSNYLYYLLYLILPLVLIFLYYPSVAMSRIPWLRRYSTILPYNHEQYKGLSFREIHMNLFDRFGNPVERRYDREEMNDWMKRAGFKGYALWFKDGWTVGAIK
jgi:uncharacterized protein YbaR (Trm112 family)/SAM-dependent methyltransferase